jgi:arylformamidase
LHVRDGWAGSHELPLEAFYGRASVVDVSGATGEIEITTIDAALGDGAVERILLKTGCTIGSGTFPESWPALSEACARALLGRGVRLIGVDAPSVDERHSKSLPVHKMIFSDNACILENLDLRRIPAGSYELIAFPIKIMSLDAAPVRAILRDLE